MGFTQSECTSGNSSRVIGGCQPFAAWLLGGVALCALATAPAVAQQSAAATADIEEIIVTGTSIRGTQPTGSDLVSVNRAAIVSIGAANTDELLASIPQMASFNQTPHVSQVGAAGSTAPSLRNIGATATLVLLDGYRLTSDNTLQTTVDPSSIPQMAIERIEVVPDGASAIYGSDAVAGVINIITRQNLNGAESSFRYGRGRAGYHGMDVNQAFGRVWNTGSAMATFGYGEHSGLENGDLPFYTNNLTPFGGQDSRPTQCNPPNVVIGGVNYTPPNYLPGVPARCETALGQSVISTNRRYSAIANAHQDLGDNLTLFAKFKYTATYDRTFGAPAGSTVTIPSTNPFFKPISGAPGATSESVLFNLFSIYGNPKFQFFGKGGNAVAGADYNLGTWKITASANIGWGSAKTTDYAFDATALAAAAAGTTAATALDPFGNGTSAATKAAIANNATVFFTHQKLYDFEVKGDGPVFALPGGDVKLAVGADYKRRKYQAISTVGRVNTNDGFASTNATRKISSVFGELFVPLVGPDNARPGVQKLNLSGAVRYDHYSDAGNTTNPKIGINYSPISALTVRGSYGTSFHAPDMGDSYAIDTRALYFANFPLVPVGSPPRDTIALAGGFPGLKPETATTYSAGADFVPEELVPGLRVSGTYYNVKYNNLILVPQPFGIIFTNPAFSFLYTINPTQAQLDAIACCFRIVGTTLPLPAGITEILDLRRHNVSALKTHGIDFQFNYHWTTQDFGSFTADVSGTHVLSYKRQGAPGAPFAADPAIIPWGIRSSLAWNVGNWHAGTAVNFSDSYHQVYTNTAGQQATQTVRPFTTWDINAAYDIPADGYLSGITISLNVNNIMAANPPQANVAGGYSNTAIGGATPLGRTVWFGILKKW